jgi:hypothetical protein
MKDTLLYHPNQNVLIGFPPPNTNETTLEKYSLSTWKVDSCPAVDFVFSAPPSFPHQLIPQPLI